jgi:hypothetical protein
MMACACNAEEVGTMSCIPNNQEQTRNQLKPDPVIAVINENILVQQYVIRGTHV